ncbi:MAG: deoxyguanosinetriphosphate triphosphohydrolase, partial [Lachnospiraceae bacterium]
IFHGTNGEWLVRFLGEMAYRYVFTSQQIYKLELTAQNILTFLMNRLIPAAIRYDSPMPMQFAQDKLIALISENYKQSYHQHAKGKSEEEKLYLRLLLVTDYVSGMTDSYAKDLYQELNGIL